MTHEPGQLRESGVYVQSIAPWGPSKSSSALKRDPAFGPLVGLWPRCVGHRIVEVTSRFGVHR